MNRWYVVHARPYQERRAEANLVRQGFRVWRPVMERSRRHARRIETVRSALFSGYLFVELDIEHAAWRAINGTFGVRRLLADGLYPQALPEGFVAALRDAVGTDGLSTAAPADLQPGGAGHYCRWPLRRMRGGGPAARAGRAGRGAARRTRRPGSGPAPETGGRRGCLTGAGRAGTERRCVHG